MKTFQICYRVDAPLHIGYHPVTEGIVTARTRYYVPARTHWGAYVAALGQKNCGSDDVRWREFVTRYERDFRFSCLFPAIKEGEPSYYVPQLQKVKDNDPPFSLHIAPEWCLGEHPVDENDQTTPNPITEADFRSRWIDSRMSTATEGGTAKHESLHEVEFLLPRDRDGVQLYLLGIVWSMNGKNPELPEEIVFGGERTYGFGTCTRVDKRDYADRWKDLFGVLEGINPNGFENTSPLLGHCELKGDYHWRGAVEVLAGRERDGERTGVATSRGLCLAPGSEFVGDGSPRLLRINCKGTWVEA